MTSEGQDGEGLLDLDAELLDADEEEGGEGFDGDGAPVALADDAEGEERQPEEERAGGVAGVGERDGRLVDALARPDHVREGGQVVVQPVALDGVQLGGVHKLGHHLDHVVGAVRRGREESELIRLEHHRALLCDVVLVRRAQVAHERLGHAHRVADHLVLTLCVLGRSHVTEAHAGEIARAVEEEPPELARLPPAAVRVVGAEHQQQADGEPSEAEWERRDSEELVDRSVDDAVEAELVDEASEARDRAEPENGRPHALHDPRVDHVLKVPHVTGGLPVALPLLVRKHAALCVALFLCLPLKLRERAIRAARTAKESAPLARAGRREAPRPLPPKNSFLSMHVTLGATRTTPSANRGGAAAARLPAAGGRLGSAPGVTCMERKEFLGGKGLGASR
eukprot:CAMPEP_0182862662 /NCGR_PEP_ID=MMETSP0034_2-20130328/6195_1 /TAXON_ID=156128 /ORGANISM="Nephroselmis pyriformis, Strain CCMP717" /LENGTH=395 /DNA_ID=CAMNT_0024994761 /DNA_START=184 /DNA_END=1368 /DNA_ORIENTATION=+